MNPADSTQFLTQTAQFTEVETLQKMEKEQAAAQSASQVLAASSMIGRPVTYSLTTTGGSGTAKPTGVLSVRGSLPKDADVGATASATTNVFTEQGKKVPLELDFTKTATGWNVQASTGGAKLGSPVAIKFDSSGDRVDHRPDDPGGRARRHHRHRRRLARDRAHPRVRGRVGPDAAATRERSRDRRRRRAGRQRRSDRDRHRDRRAHDDRRPATGDQRPADSVHRNHRRTDVITNDTTNDTTDPLTPFTRNSPKVGTNASLDVRRSHGSAVSPGIHGRRRQQHRQRQHDRLQVEHRALRRPVEPAAQRGRPAHRGRRRYQPRAGRPRCAAHRRQRQLRPGRDAADRTLHRLRHPG